MSQRLTLTISDELADQIEQRRGIRSVQDFITNAVMESCTGSAVEAELRRQLAAMHETVRQLGGRAPATPEPVPPPIQAAPVEKMGW